jgi:hypothetical protein
MVLTIEQIHNAGSDEELLNLLGGELQQLFPSDVALCQHGNHAGFLSVVSLFAITI